MYEVLQKVCSTISSFSNLIWTWSNDRISFKRIRDQIVDITDDDEDGEDDDVVIAPCLKKPKLHNIPIKGGSRCVVKNTVTQTEDMAQQRSREGEIPWRFEEPKKKNWHAPVEVVDLVNNTPNKLKNQYRPPQHVRSPHRIRRKSLSIKQKIDLTKEMNNSTSDNSTQEKRVVVVPSRLTRKSWPSSTEHLTISNPYIDVLREETLKKLQKGNVNQDEQSIAHSEYSRLLNSYIHKDPQPVVTSTAPAIKIDLTNDSGDELPTSSAESSRKKGRRHYNLLNASNNGRMQDPMSSQQGSTTCRRRVKPTRSGVEVNKHKSQQIISLDDDDDDDEDDDDSVQIIKTPSVPRVNSLQDKINAQSSIADARWADELARKYEENKSELEEMTKRLAAELKIVKERQKNNYNDLAIKLLTRHLILTESILDDEVIEPALPELTIEMMDIVNKACKSHPKDEVLINKFNYSIKRVDIHTLTGLNWLNDEIINFYTLLIVERSKERSSLPTTYSFNSFFYFKLSSSGFQSVKRWTKKVDIFSYDLIIVPVHLKMHWCLAVIDCANKTINYYDSMGTTNDQCLKRLEGYLIDEYKDKKGQVLSMDNWTKNNIKDIPRQTNGSDCGVFSCTFAEFLSRRAKFTFEQKDMPYIRQKMIYEIVTGKLLI